MIIPLRKAGVNPDNSKFFQNPACRQFMLGVLSISGVPYQMAERLFSVSKSQYISARKSAEHILEMLFQSGEMPEQIIVVTKSFIARCIMCLSMHCRAPIESIVVFFTVVVGISVSKGTIWRIRKQAARKAEEFDSKIPLTEIREMATDEIFQQGRPVLTGIDLKTNYVFLMEPTEDRTGDTWNKAFDRQKEQGLLPDVNVSDNGSGLCKGVQQAFPGISLQPDAFHMLRDLGNEVHRVESNVWSILTEHHKLERRTIRRLGKKLPYDVWKRYCELNKELPSILRYVDEVNILYEWLREYVAFSGYGYEKTLLLCTWILDEMAARFVDRTKYQKAIKSFREHLPELLAFLKRIQDRMNLKAAEFPHLNGHDFLLLCQQKYCCHDDDMYNYMEQRLYRRFGSRLPEARDALEEIIRSTHRASSMIENLNGRLRCFMNLKREIPKDFMILIKVFVNTKKPFRSRHAGWEGTSAVERLTGKKYPEFLDIVCPPIDYLIRK